MRKKATAIALAVALAALAAGPAASASSFEAGHESKSESSNSNAHGMTYERNVSAILVPAMAAVEQGQLALASQRVTKMVRACGVFSRTPAVHASLAPFCNPVLANRLDAVLAASRMGGIQVGQMQGMYIDDGGIPIGATKGSICSPVKANLKGEAGNDGDPGRVPVVEPWSILQSRAGKEILLPGDQTTPLNASSCYLVEAAVLGKAEQVAARQINGSGRISAATLVRDLQAAGSKQTAKAAIRLLYRNTRPPSDFCVLDLGEGSGGTEATQWQCGGISFDAATRGVQMGPLNIMGDGTFWGQSLKVSISGTAENAISQASTQSAKASINP